MHLTARFAAALAAASLLVSPTLRAEDDDAPAAAPYAARKVATPAKGSEYLLPDGSIYLVANDLAVPLMEKFNALFEKTHPGFKFHMDSTSSGQSVAGTIAGKSAFGSTARDITLVDKDAFLSRYGYPVTDLLVGWDNTPDSDHYPPNGKFPAGVWVNAANPIPALSLEQVESILLTGKPAGDVVKWGQLAFDEGPVGSNNGDYAKREIHIYLPVLKGLPVVSTDRIRMGAGLPWSTRVEYVPMLEDVLNAVANDPFGIGLVGWFPTDEGWDRSTELMKHVRFLPIQRDEESPIAHGTPGELYPLTGGFHLLMNWAPGKPHEAWQDDYARMVLSKEGQQIIADSLHTDGFLPLEAKDREATLKQLGK